MKIHGKLSKENGRLFKSPALFKGPDLANIILTEFEKDVASELVKSGIIKLHRRYVDDTLALMKPCDIPFVLSKFNNFEKNLKFTVDSFSDGNIHFLDFKNS